MDNEPIANDEYLTEEEEDSQDNTYINFYKFISTQTRTNVDLKNYLFDIGFFEKTDTTFLDEGMIRNIYILLDKKGKDIMKNNYIHTIRKITGEQNINWMGGKRRKSLRKRKSKRRKSLRKRRSNKSRSKK